MIIFDEEGVMFWATMGFAFALAVFLLVEFCWGSKRKK